MLNRVPLKFIASYLGMTLETLSRIRSKLSHAK
jgi:CRP-like cAMP-binding protein